jgi:hypothetical protein
LDCRADPRRLDWADLGTEIDLDDGHAVKRDCPEASDQAMMAFTRRHSPMSQS